MKTALRPSIVLALMFAPLLAAAQNNPLFLSDDPLEITIEMPLDTLIDDAKDKPEIPGALKFRGPDGKTVSIEMTMTTRGRSRLEYCRFPPLKMNLKKGQTEGTIFAGQNKLKIVTHCRDNDVHKRYLQQEFGIYKAYNLLTDYSFRARWLTVNYIDTDGKRDTETHPAFFIESSDELEDRFGRVQTKENSIPSENLDPVESSKYALFQYLIANTDWSMLRGPGDEGCCHNGKVLLLPGSDSDWVVVPYDFDQSGLLNTRYSQPSPSLNIRSVRQRLYRGRCRHNPYLDETIDLFNEKREDLEKYLAREPLTGSLQERALKYIDAFYEIVNDPSKRQGQVTGACVGS